MAIRITPAQREKARKAHEEIKRQAEEIKAQHRARLIKTVKSEALAMAGDSTKGIGRLPKELTVLEFGELPKRQQITILANYIEKLQALGRRLTEKYGSITGAQDEISKIADRIDSAGELIIQIEVETLRPEVPFEIRR